MEKELQEYTFKDAARELDVSSVTLRRWCQLLENAGYRFSKPDGTKRRLTETDRLILEKFKRWSSVMTQEEAAELLVLQLKSEGLNALSGSEYDHADEQLASALKEQTPDLQLILAAADQFEESFQELEYRLFWKGRQPAMSYLSEQWRAFKENTGLAHKQNTVSEGEELHEASQ